MASLAEQSDRTEQVQDIIERMPTRFGAWVSAIALFIFLLMILFGWLVRYPDVLTGTVSINTEQSPVKLVAGISGKLILNNIKSMQNVREGAVIAYIENPALFKDLGSISKLLDQMTVQTVDARTTYNKLPKNLELGELNAKYFALLNSLKQLGDYQTDRMFEKQEAGLRNIIREKRLMLESTIKRSEMSAENLRLVNRFYRRDSSLHAKQVLTDAEFDRTQISVVNAKEAYQSALREANSIRETIQQSQTQLQQLGINKEEKGKELNLQLMVSYNDFRSQIKAWEQRYAFRAPFNGKLQFLKFWNNNQFIQLGEPVFTIIPHEDRVYGQVSLPSRGAGKVKKGQEVIVKLEDYPYIEYGFVKGKVNSISLTTNVVRAGQNDVEVYLVTIEFPTQLTTNYGSKLAFRHELKGTAEIITHDRRLIERLFDNLKYAIRK